MKTCETCDFWTEAPEARRWERTCGEGFGRCSCPKIKRETTMPSKDEWASYSHDMMITENDEGWGFWTGSDFGCIHIQLVDEAATRAIKWEPI